MDVACLLIPTFALACELAEHPELAREPVAMAVVDGRTVLEASPSAARCGVRAGQRLAEALACCPHLLTVEARPAFYQRQFVALLDALERVSPAVEPGPLGVAYADLRGLARLSVGLARQPNPPAPFPMWEGGAWSTSVSTAMSPLPVLGRGRGRGPAPGLPTPQDALVQALLACAPAAFRPRLGVGPGKFPAMVAAHRAGPGGVSALPAEGAAAALASVSVELLPVSEDVKRRLRLLGLDGLGALAALPKAAVAAQFGPTGARAWELAQGRDPEPVRPRPRSETIVVHVSFDAPIGSRETILAAAEQLIGRALRTLARQQRAARRAVLWAATERGQSWERVVTFKEALSGRARLWTALKPVLEQAVFPGPVAELALELAALVPQSGRQGVLWVDGRRRQREHLLEALRQLKARYGHCPVGRVVEVEPWSRIPERRAALIAFEP